MCQSHKIVLNLTQEFLVPKPNNQVEKKLSDELKYSGKNIQNRTCRFSVNQAMTSLSV